MTKLLSIICLICLSVVGFAQDSTNKTKLKTYDETLPAFVIDINYKRGVLQQKLDMSDQMLAAYTDYIPTVTNIAKPKFVNGKVEGGDVQVGYFFGRQHRIGVGTGIMYLKQTGDIELDPLHVEYRSSYFNANNANNSSKLNGEYRQIISSKDKITENLSITNINIPVLIKFKHQFTEHFGVAADAGALFNVKIENSYSTNAVFDYEAAILSTNGTTSVYDNKQDGYQQADLLITRAHYLSQDPSGNVNTYFESMNQQGFNVGLGQKATTASAKSNYQAGSIGLLGQLALSYQLNYRLTLNVGGFYMLQNFNSGGDASAWRITNVVGEYNSITTGVKTSHNSSYGFNLGLRYFLGKDKDVDYDGVADKYDRCPVQKGSKTYKGCPDSDNDGIPDCDDECPFVYGVASANGCPDRDNDGIKDDEDACPDMPGPKKFDGCPDRDEDGMPDNFDRCPDEAGEIAHAGCPATVKLDSIAPAPRPEDYFDVPPIVLSQSLINFDAGKSKISPESMKILDEAIDQMNKNQKLVMFVSGHTDDIGSIVGNLLLSMSRAQAVEKYMISKGIPKQRILLSGYGKQYPIVENNSASNRAKNRRIEMKILLPVSK